MVLGLAGVFVILRPGLASLTKTRTASESTYAVLLWTNAKQRVAVLVGSGLGFRSKIDGVRPFRSATICIGGPLSDFA